MSRLRFMTWNVHELGAGLHGDDQVERVVRVVRGAEPDVLAVQELHGPDAPGVLDRLAAETGLTARLPDGTPAIAAAGGDPGARFHVGLLWSARFAPRSMRAYDRELWHNLLVLDGLVDGEVPLRVGSYHGPPFGRERRADEAERVVSAVSRPRGTAPEAVIGADWNAISADRRLRPGWVGDDESVPDRWVLHADDPYAGMPWSPAMIHQCTWAVSERTGDPVDHRADRRPGEILRAGGLHDTAALRGESAATCGHHPDDPFGPRSIDTVRVTAGLRTAVDEHQVLNSEPARSASDHLPVLVDLTLR